MGPRFVYELARGAVEVAHVWWEQDPLRRSTLGWYLRDLRRPSRVWRLLMDEAIDALARDGSRAAGRWVEDAEHLASLTVAAALDTAEGLILETSSRRDRSVASLRAASYEIYVRGVATRELALGLPDLAITETTQGHVVYVIADLQGLQRVLTRIRTLGGRVVAMLEVSLDAPGLSAES